MKKNGIVIIIILVFFLLISKEVIASWQGPIEILTGAWGQGIGEFGLVQAESQDGFPKHFLVDENGNIIIADTFNRRAQVFFIKEKTLAAFGYKNLNLGWEIQEWPTEKTGVYGITFVEGSYGKFQFYNYQGDLIREFNVTDCVLDKVNSDGSLILRNYKTGTYFKYSATGQLVKSFNGQPAELGIQKGRKPVTGGYLMSVTFSDQDYTFTIPEMTVDNFVQDSQKNLYATVRNNTMMYKISNCGRIVGKLQMPKKVLGPSEVIGIEKYASVIAEYGSPVVGSDGSIYTWKRTPDKYSILKWTWVDDPNVPTGLEPPTNLSLTPSINGLYLTWKASPNDPGCVTKYEIARSTTSGGVFSTIDTVDKGVLKYNDTTAETGTTYYYKVRAMAGSDPSAYTAEVTGKR